MLTFVMVSNKKKIILSVSNDLYTDQRVHKVCISLMEAGYEIELIGRFLKGVSKELDRPYKYRRFQLWFKKGPLFYLNLNLRIFYYLLKSDFDLYLANDLDTLVANYLAAKIKGKKVIYDSHEYFTEVPELIDRPFKQSIWKKIEAWILPNLEFTYTVSPSVALEYKNTYGIPMKLVRNFPRLAETTMHTTKPKKNVVIYQGALNVGRGLEELIDAFRFPELQDCELWIFGSGDIENELKRKVHGLQLNQLVSFHGRKNPEELKSWTLKAKIGVSIEKKLGKNYEFALPNKAFDYIHSAVPVLYSPLKDLADLLNPLEVGESLISHEPSVLAKQIKSMLVSVNYDNWVKNCKLAAKKLSWENEEQILLKIVENAIAE